MQFSDLYRVGISIVLVAMIVGVGAIILQGLYGTEAIKGTAAMSFNNSNPTALKAINASVTALTDIPNSWLGLIVVVVAAAIVIGVLVSSFGGGSGKR